MSAIRREDLLAMLRKLERERQESRAEGMKHDLASTVACSHLGVAEGIEFAVSEIAARFGIQPEEIEEQPVCLAPEPSAEAKPEKKMAPSKGEESQARKKKTS